jgi:hypothetical protein
MSALIRFYATDNPAALIRVSPELLEAATGALGERVTVGGADVTFVGHLSADDNDETVFDTVLSLVSDAGANLTSLGYGTADSATIAAVVNRIRTERDTLPADMAAQPLAQLAFMLIGVLSVCSAFVTVVDLGCDVVWYTSYDVSGTVADQDGEHRSSWSGTAPI